MTTNLFDLTGRIALVTGASRGIGESIAKTLAASGAHVIISSRKIEGCQIVADAITAEGGSAEAMACHIGDMEQISGIFSAIKEKHGKLDILVNNAGINLDNLAIRLTEEDWKKVIDINLTSTFLMCKFAIKKMLKNKSIPV